MRILAMILCSLIGVACASEVGRSPKEPKSAAKLSSDTAAAIEAREQKEHAEALARLPRFDSQRLELIVRVLGEVKYPISLDALRDKLGGRDSLVWCCRVIRGDKRRDTFSVAATAPEYELIVDYDESGLDGPPSVVGRARLCYNSPLGWRFFAESVEDFLQVGKPETKPGFKSSAKP